MHGRPHQRRGRTDDRRQHQHRHSIVGQRGRPGGDEGDNLQKQQHKQQPFARYTVAQTGSERRHGTRRQQPYEPGQADQGGATVVVGENTEGYEVGPLGPDCYGPDELDS